MTDKDLSHLKEPDYNPRVMDNPDRDNLEMSIKRYGDLSGVVFNKQTGNTVAGNQRTKEFSKQNSKIIGLQEIAKTSAGTIARGWIQPNGSDEIFTYREVDWPLDFEEQANLVANRTQGRWHEKKLKKLLKDMDPDLRTFTGFLEDEIDALLAEDIHTDDDEKPESVGSGPSLTIYADQDQQETINAAIYKCRQANKNAGFQVESGKALQQICELYLQQS